MAGGLIGGDRNQNGRSVCERKKEALKEREVRERAGLGAISKWWRVKMGGGGEDGW